MNKCEGGDRGGSLTSPAISPAPLSGQSPNSVGVKLIGNFKKQFFISDFTFGKYGTESREPFQPGRHQGSYITWHKCRLYFLFLGRSRSN